MNAQAQRRLNILDFWHTHGLPATCDAFGVSWRTLFRWQKTLADAGGRTAALAPQSTALLKHGIRRAIFTLIDPISRLAFAIAATTASSKQAAIALDAWCALLPQPPQYLLTDNGAEFKGAFDQSLADRGITHWWTYPRSPKMNARCERINRTVQASFVAYHEHLLFTDIHAFNHKLTEWLLFYNTQRPHHALNLKSPLQYLAQSQPECHMLWTCTVNRSKHI